MDNSHLLLPPFDRQHDRARAITVTARAKIFLRVLTSDDIFVYL
jgi:hypothetical protein